jgi:hypothetical protein
MPTEEDHLYPLCALHTVDCYLKYDGVDCPTARSVYAGSLELSVGAFGIDLPTTV